MISWPGVLKHADDPELDYFENRAALENFALQNVSGFDEKDCFIDAEGQAYRLLRNESEKIQLQATGERRTLDQVLGLVKAHAAQAEYCCVAKLWAPTIRDAMSIVRSVSEEY